MLKIKKFKKLDKAKKDRVAIGLALIWLLALFTAIGLTFPRPIPLDYPAEVPLSQQQPPIIKGWGAVVIWLVLPLLGFLLYWIYRRLFLRGISPPAP